jgi:hypothetical protein
MGTSSGRRKKSLKITGLDEIIYEALQSRPGCTFNWLCESIPAFVGERFLGAPQFPNLILWDRASPAAAIAIKELLRDKRIYYEVASVSRYQKDGPVVPLPFARAFGKYADRRWLPVTIHPHPRIPGVVRNASAPNRARSHFAPTVSTLSWPR